MLRTVMTLQKTNLQKNITLARLLKIIISSDIQKTLDKEQF